MSAPSEVETLVKRYLQHREHYESSAYVEARVRIDFVNPFFELLGWDVANREHRSERLRDVITEGRVRVGGAMKAPDYVFRHEGRPQFVVEAKKPSVDLREAIQPALQVRRYAWNAEGVRVGVLTDFHESAIYDARVEPHPADRADTALVGYYSVDEYVSKWPEISGTLGRDAVAQGALDALVATLPKKRGTRLVDAAFLNELEEWREELASDVARRNVLTIDELNEAVQLTIDRVVFLRVSEDRGVEPYGQLVSAASQEQVYPELLTLFRAADGKFNSGLFHFRNEPGRPDFDALTPELRVGNDVLSEFIKRLYWPQGPYDFTVIAPSVLGQVYEQFLGSVISLRGTKTAVVEPKPEVRKAGGVYYTPAHVVNHIVARVLQPRLTKTDPAKLRRRPLRILDPACGSGSFLLEAYEQLLDWHLEWYEANDPDRWAGPRQRRIMRTNEGAWRLTAAERKRILLDHVYGVDIDPQAVEVTKLSLLLKVLEGESSDTLNEQLQLFHDRALPDLDDNIRSGNSLVGTSFHGSQGMLTDDIRLVNAFDWADESDEVMRHDGFDIIVGNPPWLMAGYYVQHIVGYLHDNYATATGKFDLYYVFLEQCLRLIADDGAIGMIVPNKFFHTRAAQALRSHLLDVGSLRVVEDFGTAKLFPRATNYSAVLIFDAAAPSTAVVYERRDARLALRGEPYEVPRDRLSSGVWLFHHPHAARIYETMRQHGEPLAKLVARFGTGLQTGADGILARAPDDWRELGVERGILRPLLKGRDVRAFQTTVASRLVLFPYREGPDDFTLMSTREVSRYAVAWKYLRRHEARLDERLWFGKNATELTGNWYGLMYVDQEQWFAAPHLLTPSLSDTSNFTRGSGDLFATGTAGVTSVVPLPTLTEDLGYLLGVLNSSLLSLYALDHSPLFQGGYRKFSAPYLADLPIKRIDSTIERERDVHDDIVSMVESVEDLEVKRARTASTNERRRIDRLILSRRRELDRAVAALYEIGAEDFEFVEEHLQVLAWG